MYVKNSKGGYGVVYQEIMSSDKLHRDSKVIYAYLCSYANIEGVCYPTRERIMNDLQMSKTTLYKYMKPLVDIGVVQIEKTKTDKGLLSKNVYHLCHKIDVTQHGTPQHGTPQHGTPQHGTPQHGTPQNGTLTLIDLNSNILNNNNINSNTINNTQGEAGSPHAKNQKKKSEPVTYSDDPELNDAIVEFIKFRKGIKKPMSDRAITLMINKLESLSHDKHEQVQILNQSIMQGWTGLYELKDDRQNGSRGQAKSRSASYQGGFDDDFKQYLTDK